MSRAIDEKLARCIEGSEGNDESLYTIFESETIHRSCGAIEKHEAVMKEKTANYVNEERSKFDVRGLLQDLDGQLTQKSLLCLASALQTVAPKIASYNAHNHCTDSQQFIQTRKSTVRLCDELIRHISWLAKESSMIEGGGRYHQSTADTDAVANLEPQPSSHITIYASAAAQSPVPASTPTMFTKPVLMPVQKHVKVTAGPSRLQNYSAPSASSHSFLSSIREDGRYKYVSTPVVIARTAVSSTPPATTIKQVVEENVASMSQRVAKGHRITSESDVGERAESEEEEDSSFEEVGIAIRKAPRSSAAKPPTYKFDPNTKPYRSFHLEMGDKQYEFIVCGEFFGTVSVKPKISSVHRKMLPFCFCNKRNFVKQADYIYCHAGNICNHLVHKHCVQNFSSMRQVDYASRLSKYVCHMCEEVPQTPEIASVQDDEVYEDAEEEEAEEENEDDEEDELWKEEDTESDQEYYEAEEKPQLRKIKQVKSRKTIEEEDRLSKKARHHLLEYDNMCTASEPKVGDMQHSITIGYMPNLFQETGKTDHILTIGTGGKVYYVYLYSRVGSTTYGCYGFPEILPAIPRTAQKQLKKDLCFCTDRHSSANWYQNYYVFCKDGTTCNHLVHRNCLRDYHTKKEREYNTVFNLNFVCDGCRKQQENEEF